MKNLKGQKAQILKSEYESTNGGISSKYTHLILTGENVCTNYTGDENNENVVKLVKRHLFGSDYYHAEPIKKEHGLIGPMFGGNYLAAVGSMFANLKYPIPIHDRYETPQQYQDSSN